MRTRFGPSESTHLASSHLESKDLESKYNEREIRAAAEPAIEVQPALEESANATHQPRPPVARRPAGEEGQRARGRRRRGGRGRGGRGREQAVAQAFSPAAAKGDRSPFSRRRSFRRRSIRSGRTRRPCGAASAPGSLRHARGRVTSAQRHRRARYRASRLRQEFLV